MGIVIREITGTTVLFEEEPVPTNPETGEPYFTINKNHGWGKGWVSGIDFTRDALERLGDAAIAGCVAGKKLRIAMELWYKPKKKRRGKKWRGYPKT